MSVCIPARNHGAFVGRALASVLDQRVECLEVVVHDDASTDETGDIVRSFDDGRIDYVRSPHPLGVASARNSCLERAGGRYIAWLDADDEYAPGALREMLAQLVTHESASFIHGGFDVIDDSGQTLPAWPAPFESDVIEPAARAFENLLARNEVTTSTVLVRREAHDRAGPFRDGAGRSSSDWAMWLRLALEGDVGYIAEPVARYRRHADTISHATTATGERLRCDIAVVGELLRAERARLPERRHLARIASAALAVKALELAGDLFTRSDFGSSLETLRIAARLTPTAAPRAMARLMAATACGDSDGCYHANREVLRKLARRLEGTRLGARLAVDNRPDPDWDAVLERAASALRMMVPPTAVVGTVTKWDPTLLRLANRRGMNFPDRSDLPGGYPVDGEAAIEHLELLRRRRGLTHLVFTSASLWWLDHYRELYEHLEYVHMRVWETDDCVIYALRGRPT